MFYKIFINNRKILFYLLKLKNISKKREKNSHFNISSTQIYLHI